jgi:tetratricopeptide (TPR) repeat protein
MNLWLAGEYDRAIVVARKALQVAEEYHGPNHLNVASSLNNIAVIHLEQGDHIAAEPLAIHSLAIVEKAIGCNIDEDVATLLDKLRRSCDSMFMFMRYVDDLSKNINTIAFCHMKKGDHAKAELLFKRSIAIVEGSLGPECYALVTPLVNLALLYQRQGDYVRTIPIYERAVAIEEKAYDRAAKGLIIGEGPPPSEVIKNLEALATLYRMTNRPADALPLEKRVQEIRESKRSGATV